MTVKDLKGKYNRAPIFDRDNYVFWKKCMSVHNQLVSMEVWDVVVNGRFQLQLNLDGVFPNKPQADWTTNDTKKFQYDLKAINILISL